MALEQRQPTLQVINSDEISSIKELERRHPNLWLLIEVTREDEWEVYEGKLIATAEDPLELVDIGQSYDMRGIINLTTRGVVTEPQPAFIG